MSRPYVFMYLPHGFITTIQNTFGDGGRARLAVLPDLIDKTARRWCLTNVHCTGLNTTASCLGGCWEC